MSFLNRQEELRVPSCRLVGHDYAYSIIVLRCYITMLPIKQVLSVSSPGLPMAMTLPDEPTLDPALAPIAMLPLPELKKSAPTPMAVLLSPVLAASAP